MMSTRMNWKIQIIGRLESMREHNVGERFEDSKLIYEIRESDCCIDCAFFINDENVCTIESNGRFEECSKIFRYDGKDVIFVKVGEAGG